MNKSQESNEDRQQITLKENKAVYIETNKTPRLQLIPITTTFILPLQSEVMQLDSSNEKNKIKFIED